MHAMRLDSTEYASGTKSTHRHIFWILDVCY